MLCLLLEGWTGAHAQAPGQVIREDGGGIFMEELSPSPTGGGRTRSNQQPWNPGYQDLGNVGVKIDSRGKIIPLIQKQGGPVMPEFSETTVYDEPWWMFAPPIYATPFSPWGVPYGSVWRGPFASSGFPSALGPYYPGAPIPPVGPVGPLGPVGPVGPVAPVQPVFPYGLPWAW